MSKINRNTISSYEGQGSVKSCSL